MAFHRESVSYDEVPVRPVRPVRDVAHEALADVDHALERLSAFGVKVPADSRLHQARDIIAEAAHTGRVAPVQRGDLLGLRALEVAFDYAAICEALPPRDGPVAALRRELHQSLQGALEAPDDERGSVQLQSQLIIRSAFARANVSPYHPTHSPGKGRKSPDILLANGLSEYAVEVKRPTSACSILSRLDDARDQLEGFGLPGAVIIDVTDCVRDVSQEDLDAAIRRIALMMYDRVFIDGYGYLPGYAKLMNVGVLARRAWGTIDGEDHSMVQVHTVSTVSVFAQAQGSLLDHRARWIRKSLQDGIGQLYRTLTERA